MSKSSKRKRKRAGPEKPARQETVAMRPEKRRAPKIWLVLPALAAAGIAAFLVLKPRGTGIPIPEAGGKNLLVISIDTCRADHIGAYGSAAARTPNIDRLAAEGVLFENCLSPVPLTLPAHSSLFTGVYPPGHKVRNNGTYRLGPGPAVLAEVLKGRGYRTAAFVSSFVLLSKFGLNRGFDRYDDSLDGRNLINNFKSEIRAGDVYDKFKFWLDKQGSEKFFAWVHLYDPHFPYVPPQEFAALFPSTPEGRYDGEIAYADSIIGRIFADLKEAGTIDKTLVVVCADHGESFGEHGEIEHGIFCYQNTLRVPLILANREIFPGPEKIRPKVSLTDVMPTVLDILGIPAPAGVQGRSLVPLVRKKDAGADERTFYLESVYGREEMGWAPLTGIISGPYKYISLPQPELYDLESDPEESKNLAAEKATVSADMNRLLASTLAGLAGTGDEARTTLSAEDRERLRALGYLSAVSNKAAGEMDPKLGILVDKEVRACFEEAEKGKADEAESRLKALRAKYPGIEVPLFYDVDYIVLRRRGKVRESRALLAEAVSKYPLIDRFYMLSALTAMEMRDYGEAAKNARDLLKNSPAFSSAYTVLGQIAEKTGDPAGARENYKKALDLEPQNLSLKSKYAELLIAGGEFAAAAPLYDEMLGNESVLKNADFLYKIALFNMRYGTEARAEDLMRRALALERSGKHLFNCAVILARSGKQAEALPLMEEAVGRHAGELSPEQIRVAREAIDAWKAP